MEAPVPIADPAAEIRRQVEARRAEELAEMSDAAARPDEPATSSFVRECLQANELGDGALWAALHRGRFVYEATSGIWLEWCGHHWRPDVTGRALASVENVAVRYLDELKAVLRQLSATENEEQGAALADLAKRLGRRIDRLRTVRGREACLKFAATLPDDF